MEILSIIPARSGSKGIPGKNIKNFAGKPLLAHSAEVSLSCNNINRTILSTDDPEIKKIGIKLGLEVPFLRPKKLSEDDTPTLLVIKDLLNQLRDREGYKPFAIVILQPTSPLRRQKHLNEALDLFINNDADSLVSTVKVPHNMNPFSVMELDKKGFLNPFLEYDELRNMRQKKPVFFARNGAAIYITKYSCLMKKNSLFGSKILNYQMEKEFSVDLDDEVDWKIAENLYKVFK